MLRFADFKAGKGDGTRLFARLAFGLAVFTSAFLLFQVQLLLGKFLLPWFGGTLGVWATCLLFLQLLLGGYFYAHQISISWRLPSQGKIPGARHLTSFYLHKEECENDTDLRNGGRILEPCACMRTQDNHAYRERNFYGAVAVHENWDRDMLHLAYEFMHGQTSHGIQLAYGEGYLLELGGFTPEPAGLFCGKVAEIIIFKGTLGSDDRSAITRYLTERHQL